jgi:hypothetical protein
MREMEADALAVSESRRMYEAAQQVQTGAQAVQDSVSVNTLKGGYNLGQTVNGAAMGKPASRPNGAPQQQGYKVAQNYAQQVRFVKGRAFYQNGATWTDAAAQQQQNLKRKDVKFNSDEYFALLRDHPGAAPWLSLGNEVDVVLGDTLYVIR